MLGMRDCGISPTPPLTSRPCIFSAVPFFFLLLLEVSQVHQELVLVSPAQPHQILSVLKVVVTILGISAYYRRKELDWSITATKDLKWYSVATTKDNKNNTMAKTIVKIIQVTFFFTTGITKYMKKNLDMTKPSYSKHILTVPWLFLISRFHCTNTWTTSRETCFLRFVQHGARFWKCLWDYVKVSKKV